MFELVPFELHPEVVFLIISLLIIGIFVSRVLQPKAVSLGYPKISVSQKIWFFTGIISMWFVSYWPVHEIAERYLYSIHMIQHLFLSMLIPAMFLLAVPEWLFDLVFEKNSRSRQIIKTLSKPIPAGLIFNSTTLLLHWTWLVQESADSGVVHFLLHMLIFFSGMLMWMPVIGPVKGWQLSPLGKCVYLFAMSIVPTIPGGWLVFAEDVVYKHYDTSERLWNVDVISDQQAAGAVMKLLGGFFLWGVIIFIFFRDVAKQVEEDLASE